MSMTLTEDQRQAFAQAAQPLMAWLAGNCHPHCEAQVTGTGAVLVEGIAAARTAPHENNTKEPQ